MSLLFLLCDRVCYFFYICKLNIEKCEITCNKIVQVLKEYRKFIRRHSWLPKCLRCSKTTGSTSSGSCTAGVGNASAGVGSGKDSNNQSAPNTDSTGLTGSADASGTHQRHNQQTLVNSVSTPNIVINNLNLSNMRPSQIGDQHHTRLSNYNRQQQGIFSSNQTGFIY